MWLTHKNHKNIFKEQDYVLKQFKSYKRTNRKKRSTVENHILKIIYVVYKLYIYIYIRKIEIRKKMQIQQVVVTIYLAPAFIPAEQPDGSCLNRCPTKQWNGFVLRGKGVRCRCYYSRAVSVWYFQEPSMTAIDIVQPTETETATVPTERN